jgi:S1-C subfamily serine protease
MIGRICFGLVLVTGFLLNPAYGQNPLKILDFFKGSESTEQAPLADSTDELTAQQRVDDGEAPKVVPLDATENLEEIAPPLPVPDRQANSGKENQANSAKEKTEKSKSANSTQSEVVSQESERQSRNTADQKAEVYFGASIKGAERGKLGVEVTAVDRASPAAKAGIQTGDRLVTIAGTPVVSAEDLSSLFSVLSPGDRVEVEWIRDRRKASGIVTLAARTTANTNEQSHTAQASANIPLDSSRASVIPADDREIAPASDDFSTGARLGIVVVDAAEETGIGGRRRAVSGAIVDRVNENSPAAKARLPVGALIVAADGHRIDKAEDLVNYIATLKPGDEVELSYFEGKRLHRLPLKLSGQEQVKKVADFQPVPGNNGPETEPEKVERPILKELGERFPRVRRVDRLIDRFSK